MNKGYYITEKGYKRVYKPGHGNCNTQGYVYEHRLVMSEHIGRPLKLNECVHHINGNGLDNRLKNLVIISQAAHLKTHLKPRRGEMATGSKLTAAQVKEIRRQYGMGVKQSVLAIEYGISAGHTCLIVHRKAWRHV